LPVGKEIVTDFFLEFVAIRSKVARLFGIVANYLLER